MIDRKSISLGKIALFNLVVAILARGRAFSISKLIRNIINSLRMTVEVFQKIPIKNLKSPYS